MLLLGLVLGSEVRAEDLLNDVVQSRTAGAGGYALHLLDTHQPTLRETPDVWIHWERERILTLAARAEWPAIIQRRRSPPPELPADFLRWWDTRVAEAHLGRRDGVSARTQLLPLIWGTPASALELYLPEWRRLIMQSYLVEQRHQDAYLALLRYELDHGPAPPAMTARIWLGVDRADKAAELLVRPVTEPEHLLALESSYALGYLPAAELAVSLRLLVDRVGADTDVGLSAWIALHGAAVADGDAQVVVEALEGIRAHRAGPDVQAVGLTPDSLWEAYGVVAVETANANGLLVGGFDDWLTLAESLRLQRPLVARAVYAHLVREAGAEVRNSAEVALADSLMQRTGGSRILKSLYLSPFKAERGAGISPAVLNRLVEAALNAGDTSVAMEFAGALSESRNQISRILSVRVALIGDTPDEAVVRLDTLLGRFESPDVQTSRHLHRCIVALSDRAPAETDRLLHRLLSLGVDSGTRHKIMLSLGTLSARQGKFEKAATYFLTSATAASETGDDGWLTESLLEAAHMFALANLPGPARELYGEVLRHCEDPARRAFIINSMEQLGP